MAQAGQQEVLEVLTVDTQILGCVLGGMLLTAGPDPAMSAHGGPWCSSCPE